MNAKLLILIVVMAIACFATDFVIHGLCLSSTYQATAELWRPEPEMVKHFPFMLVGQFVAGLFIALIFVQGYKGTGVGEGVRFGLLIGGLFAGHHLIMHAVSPYPVGLTLAWIGFGLAQGVVLGVLATLVYRTTSPRP